MIQLLIADGLNHLLANKSLLYPIADFNVLHYNLIVSFKFELIGEYIAMLTKDELPECAVATTVQIIGSKWKFYG